MRAQTPQIITDSMDELQGMPGLLADHQIRELAQNQGMIEPFVEKQNKDGVISYGLSSYGYDARSSGDFKIFTNVDNVVDPKISRKPVC